MIAEHGLNDWQAAKRKACRHLGLPDHEALPGNEEVEQALRDYNTLFQGTVQMASLRAQRVDALDWMEKLSQWKPLLTGAVAAGWATEHSEVRLELEADGVESVSSANPKSDADRKRRSGCFSRQRRTMRSSAGGTSVRSVPKSGGSSLSTALIVSTAESR